MRPEIGVAIGAAVLCILSLLASETCCKHGGQVMLRIVSACLFFVALGVTWYYSLWSERNEEGEPYLFVLIRHEREHAKWIIIPLTLFVASSLYLYVIKGRKLKWKVFAPALMIICIHFALEFYAQGFE